MNITIELPTFLSSYCIENLKENIDVILVVLEN